MSKGKLYLVGIGPGDRDNMTFKAYRIIQECGVVVGYKKYTQLLRELEGEGQQEHLLQGKKVISSPMRDEEERCRKALDEALLGEKVALVSSGDAGIYGMAGIALQILEKEALNLEVEVVPGVTAASAAAALLGAPLMHDFAVISLSDLLTSWELIEKRLQQAGEGDFVVVIYNPRSKGRVTQVQRAQQILLDYRSAKTPVGIVRNAYRREGSKSITTLGQMPEQEMDMATIVIIGNSQSYVNGELFITPRGYPL